MKFERFTQLDQTNNVMMFDFACKINKKIPIQSYLSENRTQTCTHLTEIGLWPLERRPAAVQALLWPACPAQMCSAAAEVQEADLELEPAAKTTSANKLQGQSSSRQTQNQGWTKDSC